MNAKAPAPATWIFQANPKKYDIATSLAAERVELWNLRQHASKVKVGDRVLVWISGSQSGIYAVGEVLSDPVDQPDSTVGRRYWKSTGGQQIWPRVKVRYSRVLLDRPLYKKYLEFDAALHRLAILRQPQGTNFAVTADEWKALDNWLSS